ncbi:hypothetical protein DL1_11400 [Thioclava dalianensis]|uniref:DUF3168 domain-containing protein n=1 Tax=Thioclava dalianensis TaxID=1185766 RepID=A0A074TEC1_9RHOB|nr:DUF3168 domain-containing protein [Thioclava dalianensis]KEP68525.1 hypothetical protein DL1_11400 [Thioclava dalianensis]SFN84119.1 Protein of unknown function [Thioclava dalianensis]
MSADIEVQKAMRARLVANTAVTTLVPATSILDRNETPNPRPSIIMGETQEVDAGTSLKRTHTRIYHTLHIWTREVSLAGVKTIAGAIRQSMRSRLALAAPYHCGDLKISTTRFMRDPDGESSHGVVTVEVLVSEDL